MPHGGYHSRMSNSHVWIVVIVFAVFAFGFIGVMLTGSFVLDRRRVKDVHAHIPERSEGVFDHPNPPSNASLGIKDPPEDHHTHQHMGHSHRSHDSGAA